MKNQDEYLKMVLALPNEFFKEWEWNAGDRAITLTSNREVMIVSTNLKLQLIESEFIEVIFPYSDLNTHDIFKKRDLRPLPRQDQLQDMLLSPKLQPHFNLWTTFRTFEGFFKSETLRFHNLGVALEDSFEMLWLKCVMQAKYNAEWRNGNWVHIKDDSTWIGYHGRV